MMNNSVGKGTQGQHIQPQPLIALVVGRVVGVVNVVTVVFAFDFAPSRDPEKQGTLIIALL